jgi:hypothetical protein
MCAAYKFFAVSVGEVTEEAGGSRAPTAAASFGGGTSRLWRLVGIGYMYLATHRIAHCFLVFRLRFWRLRRLRGHLCDVDSSKGAGAGPRLFAAYGASVGSGSWQRK